MILAATMAMTMAMPAFAAEPTTGSITLYKYEKLESDTTHANGEAVVMDGHFALKNVPFELEKTTLAIDELTTSTVPADVAIDAGFTKQTGKTDGTGMLAFNNLPLGVYRVTETKISAVKEIINQFLVSVPMTKADGSGWIYNVKVYPKNVLEQGPQIVKTADKTTVTVGQTIKWTIKSDIPDGMDAAESYVITDQLDTRLTYDAANAPLTVKVGDTTIANATVAVTDANLMTIDLTPAKAAIAAAKSETNKQIVITLPTKVNGIGDLSAIQNIAKLSYTNETGKKYTDSSKDDADPTTVPTVTLGGFKIFKTDADNKALKNAHFALYAKGEDGKPSGEPITGTFDVANNVYLVDVSKTTALDIISGADGKAVVKGLAYGNYLLVETQAPTDATGKSYNLLNAPKEIAVAQNTLGDTADVQIINKMGFVLPITGGMGTTLFTLAGVLLLGGAAFVLLKKDKKSEAK